MTCSCDVISARTCSCDVISVRTCSCDVISVRTCSCDVISVRTCSCDVISVRTCSFDVMYSVLSTALSKTNVNQNASFIYAIEVLFSSVDFLKGERKLMLTNGKDKVDIMPLGKARSMNTIQCSLRYVITPSSGRSLQNNPGQTKTCNYPVVW
jgi:hypothetical protein